VDGFAHLAVWKSAAVAGSDHQKNHDAGHLGNGRGLPFAIWQC